MSTLFARNLELNEEYCWTNWRKVGSSLSKVAKQLEADGKVSLRTGKRYSSTAILHAAWRYALKNPDKAYETAKYMQDAVGQPYSQDDWKRDLIQGAGLVFFKDEEKVRKFIIQHGLQQYT